MVFVLVILLLHVFVQVTTTKEGKRRAKIMIRWQMVGKGVVEVHFLRLTWCVRTQYVS